MAGAGRLGEEPEHGVCILEVVAEAERARAAPRAAIVECDGVPSGAPYRLREIQILLVARQAVQKNERRMRPGAGGEIRDCVDAHAAGRDVQHFHARGMGGVARRIDGDGLRRLRAEGRGGQCDRGDESECSHGRLEAWFGNPMACVPPTVRAAVANDTSTDTYGPGY